MLAPLRVSAETLPEVVVEAETLPLENEHQVVAGEVPATSPNTADLLRDTPGGNVNANGPLSGIAQYRGMYGDRVNVRIDGMLINSGGPNAMDAPLSYVPRAQLDSLVVERGISSVSAGSETIGGTIRASSKTARFGDSDKFELQADLDLDYTGVNDGVAAGVLVGAANRNHRVSVIGSHETADDTEFPGGEIFPTEYERSNYGAAYGFRDDVQELSLSVKRNETNDTGTPALPMDIAYIDSDFYQGSYQRVIGDGVLDLALSHSDVEHLMTNFHLRTPPAMPMQYRQSLTDSTGTGGQGGYSLPLGNGELTLGVDGHEAQHNAVITNPNDGVFFIDNFNDIQRDQFGLFAEWTGTVAADWELEAGLRYNRVAMDAGEVAFAGLMGGMADNAAKLRDAFNAADRDVTDDNLDWVLKFSRPLNAGTTLLAEVGRKTRSPSYQERYLWLPLQSTGGLADGRSYIGNIDLDPEVAHEAGLGVDWRTTEAHLTPRIFYRYVKDYIQGVPSENMAANMISNMMTGAPALEFANVDAVFYGIDLDYGWRISDRWHLGGILSYVRGERDDEDDNLYRIAPLRATAALTYRLARWEVTGEGVFVAEQDEVADFNDEQTTDGYALLNLYGRYDLSSKTAIWFGAGNLLDEEYEDHLSGINRVAGSDVGLGERVPGAGRNLFVGFNYRY
ncbi:MAG: TonB-dependent receptor [Pseudomonadota bacterium]